MILERQTLLELMEEMEHLVFQRNVARKALRNEITARIRASNNEAAYHGCCQTTEQFDAAVEEAYQKRLKEASSEGFV